MATSPLFPSLLDFSSLLLLLRDAQVRTAERRFIGIKPQEVP
jgi:hypothetical protein